MSRLLLFCLSLSSVAACHTMVVMHGVEVAEGTWEESIDEITPRATYELGCEPAELTFRLLREGRGRPLEVGVEGCRRRVVYLRIGAHWVLNSEIGEQLEPETTDEEPVAPAFEYVEGGGSRNGVRLRFYLAPTVAVTFSFLVSSPTTAQFGLEMRTPPPNGECRGLALRGGAQELQVPMSGLRGTLPIAELAEGLRGPHPELMICNHRWTPNEEERAAFTRFLRESQALLLNAQQPTN